MKVDVVPPEEPDAEPVEEGAAELEPASTKLATRGPEGVLNGRVVDVWCYDTGFVIIEVDCTQGKTQRLLEKQVGGR